MINLFRKKDHKKRQANDFFESCVIELEGLVANNKTSWDVGERILNRLDLNAGTLTIHYSDNRVVMADVAVIGTYDHRRETFLWAYANPTIPGRLAEVSKAISEWGVKKGFLRFGDEVMADVPLDAARDILAIANHLVKAEGAEIIFEGQAYPCLLLNNIKRL